MPYGYTGKILRVNLTTGEMHNEEHDDNFYRTYFGGRGLIGYYLLTELKPGIDPLGPENLLIFAAGPITGAPMAGCGRNSVGAKSPLSGGYGEAEAGGFFGAEMKQAGFDAVIFTGKAEKPVYLWLNDGKAELRDAGHLWGKDTFESQEAIREELGDKRIRTAQIARGGEKMVRYACVINDLKHSAGRSGMGAVMGSKNLKAVAARGKGGMQYANPEKVRELAKFMADHWKEHAWGLHEHGTNVGIVGLDTAGGLPTRNFQTGTFEGIDKISGEAMTNTILIDRENCYSCAIRCKRVVKTETPYKVDPVYGGPEYETIGAMGSCCGVDDLVAISKANELCNAYSLDTIGTGTTIAFAMECFEAGILTKEDTGGIDLRFGNADAVVKMTEMIGNREGLGDLLAEGTKRAAEKLGKGSMKFAMQVKGQEFPMHEPRFKQGMGFGFAVCPTGACHMQANHDSEFELAGAGLDGLREIGITEPMPTTELSPRKVRAFTYNQNWWSFHNMAVHCIFVPWSYTEMAEVVNAVTGWNTSVWEILKVGERGTTLARVFNVREGFTADDDTLPDRMFEPLPSGALKGTAVDREGFAEAKQYYYGMRGWDANGVPTAPTLAQLNIDWAGDLIK